MINVEFYNIKKDCVEKSGLTWINPVNVAFMQTVNGEKFEKPIKLKNPLYLIQMQNGTQFIINENGKSKFLESINQDEITIDDEMKRGMFG